MPTQKTSDYRKRFEKLPFVQVMKKATDYKEDQYNLLTKIFFDHFLESLLEEQREEILEALFRLSGTGQYEGEKMVCRVNLADILALPCLQTKEK